MTTVLDPPARSVPSFSPPDVWSLGAPRLLAPASTHAAHLSHHGPLPRIDRDRLTQFCSSVGLLGRGGAAFPVARKLQSLPASGADSVVVNAHEGEPASGKDRALVTVAPHLVIDGALLLAAALDAQHVVIAVTDDAANDAARRAVAERRDAAGIVMHRSSSGFVGGEVRALLDELSGGSGRAPGRRVMPTAQGLRGRPTFAGNAESVAQIAVLARLGPAGFARMGSAEEAGTRLFTVCGAVRRPGVVEAPCGVPLGVVLDAAGAAASPAVLVGGYHGAWIPAVAEIPLSHRGVLDVGGTLGAGVIAVPDPSGCLLGEVSRVAHWLAAQSAGQCGPCVFGLPSLAEQVDRLRSSRSEPERRSSLAALLRLTDQLPGRGACAHPDGAARFVRSALTQLDREVSEHVHRGGCGRPDRPCLPLGGA